MSRPTLSVIVLAWNRIDLTTACVQSVRMGTRCDYELIIVDNRSTDEAAQLATRAADRPVLNDANLGFAAGHNSGLAVARGRYVAFVNNDTVLPEGWDEPLVEVLATNERVGIVLPAVTAAGNPVSVRSQPGTTVERLLPFGEFPSGVVYVMRTDVIRALGGWNEEYRPASAEDLDLAFTVWAHGLDIDLDTRVLVEHESQATMRMLPDLQNIYRSNLQQFLDRWESGPDGPLLPGIDQGDYRANLARGANGDQMDSSHARRPRGNGNVAGGAPRHTG